MMWIRLTLVSIWALAFTISSAQELQVFQIPKEISNTVKQSPLYFVFESLSKKAAKDTKMANILADRRKHTEELVNKNWKSSKSIVFLTQEEYDSKFATAPAKVRAVINLEETALELFVSSTSVFRFEFVEHIYCRDVVEDLIAKCSWALETGRIENSSRLKSDTIYAKGYFLMGETKYVGGVNWSDPWARRGSSTFKGGNYTTGGGYADESHKANKWLDKNYPHPVHMVSSREQSTLDYNLKMYDVLLYNEMRKHPEVNKDKELAKKVKQDFRNKIYPREPGHIYQSTWKLKSNYLNISKKNVTITFACGFESLSPIAYSTMYDKVYMFKVLEDYLRFVN